MANRFLNQIYTLLYGEQFSYSDFSKRLKMQKGIYLLQEMGVPVGNYNFSWYKHGPYSQSLLDDMYIVSASDSFVLTPDNETAVDELSKALKKPGESPYSSEEWVECLGSLHYLKENIFDFNADDNELLRALEKRKPHLNDNNSNEIALSRIKELFS